MIKISFAGVWVHDQDEALAFYTEKLGWEVRADVTLPELGNYRWLTVGPPNQPDISVLLNAIPGPPVLDEATAGQIRSLMAKGWAGNVLLTTDDVHADYEQLRARGVEFTEEPEERPYGIDTAFRDRRATGSADAGSRARSGLSVDAAPEEPRRLRALP
jgi:catechol 2,3-dioxygenase-like lactoylglutathione lyase family enzyme